MIYKPLPFEWDRRPDLEPRAYYFGFKPTGDPSVDKLLLAVCRAGKAFHHTNEWCDEVATTGKSPIDWIQEAADELAGKRKEQP